MKLELMKIRSTHELSGTVNTDEFIFIFSGRIVPVRDVVDGKEVENRQEFLNLKNQLAVSKKYKRNQITVIK